jgi:hypothetical protein
MQFHYLKATIKVNNLTVAVNGRWRQDIDQLRLKKSLETNLIL